LSSPNLPSAAGLIDSFLKDLQGIAGLFSSQAKGTTVPRMFFIAGSDAAFSWQSDVDGAIVGIHDDGAAGASVHVVALSKFNTADLTGTSKLFPQILYSSTVTAPSFVTGIRYSIRKGDRIWFANSSASPFRCTLWIET
jgi:hypothetical protein